MFLSQADLDAALAALETTAGTTAEAAALPQTSPSCSADAPAAGNEDEEPSTPEDLRTVALEGEGTASAAAAGSRAAPATLEVRVRRTVSDRENGKFHKRIWMAGDARGATLTLLNGAEDGARVAFADPRARRKTWLRQCHRSTRRS